MKYDRIGLRPTEGPQELSQAHKEAFQVIRLVDACQGGNAFHGLCCLLENQYQGFFVRLPMGFKACFASTKPGSKQRTFDVSFLNDLASVEFLQLKADNLLEIASGQTTNAMEFGDYVLQPMFRQRDEDDPDRFCSRKVERIILRPKIKAVAERTPLHTTGSGTSGAAKTVDFKSGDERYLFANLSVGDLYIAKGALRFTPALDGDAQYEAQGEASAAEFPPAVEAGSTEFDPLNFKKHCPAVYEIMEIALERVSSSCIDSAIKTRLQEKYGDKNGKRRYESVLGNGKRADFASRISRTNYKIPEGSHLSAAVLENIGKEAFIQQKSYSQALKLVMTIAKKWVEAGMSENVIHEILQDLNLETNHQGDVAGNIVWLVTGEYSAPPYTE